MDQQYVSYLLAALAVGVGLGSALAGVWSAGKIELGMVPWAAAGMAVSCLLLYLRPGRHAGTPLSAGYLGSCLGLLALGFSAGFFDVPLQAFLQHRSPPQSRGSILAAYNFIAFSGMLLAGGIFWVLSEVLGLSRPANLPLRRPGHAAGGSAQRPLPRRGGPPLRPLAADAAGLSGAGRRDGEHSRDGRGHARLEPRELGRRNPPGVGLPAARPHDCLRAVLRGLVDPLVRPSGGHYPHPSGEAAPSSARFAPPGRLCDRGTWFVSFRRAA